MQGSRNWTTPLSNSFEIKGVPPLRHSHVICPILSSERAFGSLVTLFRPRMMRTSPSANESLTSRPSLSTRLNPTGVSNGLPDSPDGNQRLAKLTSWNQDEICCACSIFTFRHRIYQQRPRLIHYASAHHSVEIICC